MEKAKTFLLMTGLVLLFMLVGHAVGGEQGMAMAFLMACGLNFFSYFFSDSLVLKQYRARAVSAESAPLMHQIVTRLAKEAKLPMPKLYVIDDPVPNAFATGRNPNHAAVAATQGLLQLLSAEEIEGVLAHEMSHVKHHDILICTIAAVFAGAISTLGNFARAQSSEQGNRRASPLAVLVGAVVMPLGATVIQMAISRAREYRADEGAAYLTRHPEWLIGALLKLEDYAKKYQMRHASASTAHLFIVHPFKGAFNSLFSTHPSTPERVARLREIQKRM